ncbi:bifunctional demethylmenaquinone methyltransferase/2-methoxy-6-polyprenyl-1,4-benzoquinol methylase UbiE [Saccharicrinis sp. FJH54]|uniref:bifunctional demethylmenaquinone methyltransferase/2-methoxy-6-polyprenyl-1,4-benzoquinol methylase UbiE n=1 Tax=Saccharicrinis sp. FJH54 TaxID=3344665 RepID=UPI0035D51283
MKEDKKVVSPYHGEKGTKKEEVASMFDNISKKYDFLNIFLSFGIDRLWRKTVIRTLKPVQPKQVLDIATGTGDLAFQLAKITSNKVTGADISEGMLAVAREKKIKRNLNCEMDFITGDAENLPFKENTFDVVTVGFGIRNFQDPLAGLKDMTRVVRKGGTIAVLEFSKPTVFPVKQLYRFYSFHLIPFFGRFVSGDSRAYTYLPESVDAFPEGESFLDLMENAGLTDRKQRKLTFGIASLYTGVK